jgi:hypothetical protein
MLFNDAPGIPELRRTEAGWRASGITFRAWHSRGDASIQAHRLSS